MTAENTLGKDTGKGAAPPPQTLRLLIQGSASEPYTLTFKLSGNTLTAECTCPAGNDGQYVCKHQKNIIYGRLEGLISGNSEDIGVLHGWISSSSVETPLKAIIDAENGINQRIAKVRPALDALRFYVATTRGFRDREQTRLAAFLKDVAEAELRDFVPEEVKEWLKTKVGWVDTNDYRRGDTSGYLALLQAIPPQLLTRTKDYAYLIAKGSGRKPLSDEAITRIEQEFSASPIVTAPPCEDDDWL